MKVIGKSIDGMAETTYIIEVTEEEAKALKKLCDDSLLFTPNIVECDRVAPRLNRLISFYENANGLLDAARFLQKNTPELN